MIWQDSDWVLNAECLRAASPSPRGWGEPTRYYIINCRLLHENSTEPHWALLLQRSAVMIHAWSLDQLSYMHWLDGCHLLLHSFSDPEFFEENLSTKTGTQIAISRTLTAVHCLGYIFIQQAFLLYLETRTYYYISGRHQVRSEIRILKYVTSVGQRCRQSATGSSSVDGNEVSDLRVG